MKVIIKPGVKLIGLTPQMAFAWPIIVSAWEDWFGAIHLVVTSVGDDAPERVTGSKHKIGNAIDLRRNHLTVKRAEEFIADLKDSLGDEFDVVIGKENIHVEYDPK